MLPVQIYAITDSMMQDKVFYDLEQSALPISERTVQTFPQFLHDSTIMQYGLYSISIKVLI